MKHVTYSDKSLLIGTEAADLLMEYAAALIGAHTGDTVDINAIGVDGNAVSATFLLGEGAPLMAESANAQLEEPDNSAAIDYMREKMRVMHTPPAVTTLEPIDFEDDFGDLQTEPSRDSQSG
jgi:hypothetical protein